MRALLTLLVCVAVLSAPAGGAASTARVQLTVYAAASLTNVFPAIDPHE